MANKSNLRANVSLALVSSGFRRDDRLHSIPIDEEFSFWVDTGPIGTRSDIAPFVGIRHRGVEDLRARLLETTSSGGGTVGANVGYVLGAGYLSWAPPASPADVIRAIDAARDRLERFMTLDNMAAAWEIEGSRRPGWQYSRIATHLLRGDRQAVDEDLNSARAELCRHADELCAQFTSFAQRVQERLA
jgi:hypothetical protein